MSSYRGFSCFTGKLTDPAYRPCHCQLHTESSYVLRELNILIHVKTFVTTENEKNRPILATEPAAELHVWNVSADGPQTGGFVIRPFQTVAEDILFGQRSRNPLTSLVRLSLPPITVQVSA